jgi:tRNA(Met) C34 N-acetyltransferase TmcA
MQHEQTVTFADGTERAVVYDSEADEAHVRKTEDQLTEDAMGWHHESFESLRDDVVGRSKDVSPESLQRYAERTGETYSKVHMTARYLRDAAEYIELDCRDSLSSVTLHVVKDGPMLLTADSAEYGYIVAPRVKDE